MSKIQKTVLASVSLIAVAGVMSVSATSMFTGMSVGDNDKWTAIKQSYERPTDIPAPEDNPITPAKVELGKKLFFDPRLSKENNISCASCHNPSFAWEDNQPTSVGTPMERLGRHTPTVLNLAWGELYFWDGRAESLEDQALGPIEAAGEMSQNLGDLVKELKEIPAYVTEFKEVFGTEITSEAIGKAIATFERTVVSEQAPFDAWIKGDDTAISASAKRGFKLFNTKANCAACHSGWNFTDWGFHDIGIDDKDMGRYTQLEIEVLKHSFKTPGLRNIVERAPYMHNGSMKTLKQVVEHYNNGFVKRPSLSTEMKELNLTQEEITDLVNFMKTLSSKDKPVTMPVLPVSE